MRDRASSTALLVAGGVAFQSTHPRNGHLVPRGAGELSRKFVAAAGGRVRSGASTVDRFLIALQERLTVPGISLHYVIRKRAVEDMVRAALAEGFRQFIILGAGLDTLAIRLASERNDLAFIEVDHPATQKLKREVAGDPGGVEFLAVDFTRESLMDSLDRSMTYDATAPALFVAEAVFLYLTDDQVHDVLEQVHTRSAQTRIVFTFWSPRPSGAINFQNATFIADAYLKRKGEPGKWAIEPDDLTAFLARDRFVLRDVMRDEVLHCRFGRDVVARGEHLAVADAL